ncbi:MAG: sigma-70 family RNA polymerase sigma factor [Bryobacteraceae bacterium]
MASPSEVTQLLLEYGRGNQAALDQLMPLVYAELHRMASRYMSRQNPAHTLQATALIHEAYVRLAANSTKDWENRAHFFGIAAKSMRHVLVDHARAHHRAKRGGEKHTVPLDEGVVVSGERLAEIVALDDALTDLSKLHPRQSEVVELKYFGGLSLEETAQVLKVSPETVTRHWRAAKAWLYRALSSSSAKGE